MAFSALFWLNSHVGYVAKGAVLVRGTGNTSDDILARTVAAFEDTETFIERTLQFGSLQEGALGQLEEGEQRKAIQDVKVEGGTNGGLVTVIAKSSESETATVLAEESTETLLRMARLYLGNEKEVALTVIDQPIVSKGVVSPGIYVIKTFASAFALFVILLGVQSLVQLFRKDRGENLTVVSEEERDARFVPQKLDPTFLYPEREVTSEEQIEPEAPALHPQPKASEVIKQEEYGHAPDSSLQSVSVSMDDLPFTFETSETETEPESVVSEEKTSENVGSDREPTVVEYKRRLNELLAQK